MRAACINHRGQVFVILVVIPPLVESVGESVESAAPQPPAKEDHGLGSDHLITEGKCIPPHPVAHKAALLPSPARGEGECGSKTCCRGDVIQRFEYAPYGKESFALNPNIQFDPAYTGQKYDIETGLYYYRARYYDPILGRFTQPDTIVQNTYDPQSWNRYAYVRNNPLKYVDPSGHQVEMEWDADSDGDGFTSDGRILIQLDDNGPDPENTGRSDASDRASLDRGGSSDTGGLVGAAVRTVTSGVSSYANYWVSSQVAGYGAVLNGVNAAFDKFGEVTGCDAQCQVSMSVLMGPQAAAAFAGIRYLGPWLGTVGRAGRTAAVPEKLYHYGFSKNASSILSRGLHAGSGDEIFLTRSADLSPLQAHIDLALRPNRGLPDALFEIDTSILGKFGIDIPPSTQVGRSFNMPGGGLENIVRVRVIPPEAIRRVR